MQKLCFLVFSFLFSAILIAQSPHAAQLYGVTTFGGSNYLGSIFHYTPSTNSFTTDYSFQRKVKGAEPKCKIVAPGNGKYYGITT